jgi:hypothetical protein
MPRLARAAAASGPAARPVRVGGVKMRPDLRDPAAPRDIEIIQITTDPQVGGSHIYMEAPIFAPDSKRFILQRSGHAHGSERDDPNHQFMRCDIDDGFSLHPLTDEVATTSPSVSPDGKYLYYFVDQTKKDRGRLTLKQVNLDGTDRRTLLVLDTALPGAKQWPNRLYPLSTIRSDGKRLAISCMLYEGAAEAQTFGLMVFNLEQPAVEVIVRGMSWSNMHPQYSRSFDPLASRDLLLQENHGAILRSDGEWVRLAEPLGADIHVARDDGTNWRSLPWGRDGNERCQGHQCWRGRSDWCITSTVTAQPPEEQLFESRPVATIEHIGSKTPGGIRNHLSRGHKTPHFFHFATDIAGKRLVTDCEPFTANARIYVARLGEPGRDPAGDWLCLARPRPTATKTAHMHPFLSPDGGTGFFNSDESGKLQAYAIRGLAV